MVKDVSYVLNEQICIILRTLKMNTVGEDPGGLGLLTSAFSAAPCHSGIYASVSARLNGREGRGHSADGGENSAGWCGGDETKRIGCVVETGSSGSQTL